MFIPRGWFKLKFKILILILINIFLVVVSLATGPGEISFSELFGPHSETFRYILFDLRVPRTLALFFIGGSLALCGVLLQTLLNNPLSEPYTLGLSGGSTLGAVIFLFLNLEPVWLSLPLGATIGSVVVTLFILAGMKKNSFFKKNSLILTGVMISLFCGSVVTFLVSMLDPSRMQLAIFWMMGQVGSPRDHWWAALSVFFFIAFLLSSKNSLHLDRLLLGEETAQNLGSPVAKIKIFIIITACLLTSMSVSIAGLVGFVGLIAPHFSYLFFKTRRHSVTLTTSSLLGSILFLTSDIFSRLLSQENEIPAGSLMALMGAPILIYLLARRDRHA